MAKAKGLVVKVDRDQGRCYDSIAVQIEMEKIEGDNMLAMIYNSQMLSIHAIKGVSNRWKHSARFYEIFSDVRELKQDVVKHRIAGMAESRERYFEIKG